MSAWVYITIQVTEISQVKVAKFVQQLICIQGVPGLIPVIRKLLLLPCDMNIMTKWLVKQSNWLYMISWQIVEQGPNLYKSQPIFLGEAMQWWRITRFFKVKINIIFSLFKVVIYKFNAICPNSNQGVFTSGKILYGWQSKAFKLCLHSSETCYDLKFVSHVFKKKSVFSTVQLNLLTHGWWTCRLPLITMGMLHTATMTG